MSEKWQKSLKNCKISIKYFLNEIDNFFWDNVNQKYGWHRVNKAYLEAAGLMSRYERSPLKPLDENEFKEIKDNYKIIYRMLKFCIIAVLLGIFVRLFVSKSGCNSTSDNPP